MTRRGLSLVILAVGLLVVPALLLGWLRLRTEDRLAELVPPPQAVMVTARHVAIDGAQQVNVSVTWGEQIAVVAPEWSGTVTSTEVAAGDLIETGDRLLTLNGVARMAAATDFPFWRSLQGNVRGEDVAQLQRLLSALGLYDGPDDGIYRAAVRTAVNALGTDLGVANPGGVFDPGWIVWLPVEPLEVAAFHATLGGPAPAPGSALLEGPATMAAVRFLGGDGRPLQLDGEWIVQTGAAELTVVDGALTEESTARLIELAADLGESELFGQARMASPLQVLEIPATAVASSPSGALCVWVPDGASYTARPVTLDGGRVARVHVSSGLAEGDEVLANPGEIFDSPTCP